MSKKTNEAKRKAAMKPQRKSHARKGRRPNPVSAIPRDLTSGPWTTGNMLDDPIILRHAVGFILRMIQRFPPNPHAETGFVDFNPSVFLKPEGLTSTVNPDPPEDEKPE